MGTGSLSQGVRRPVGGVDHPPSSRAKVKAREMSLFFLWAFVACYMETFILQ